MTYYYQSAVSGDTVPLDVGDSVAGFQGGIDGHQYSYDFTRRGIDKAAELPCDVVVPWAGTWERLDNLLTNAEADYISRRPGAIFRGDWRKSAYITGASHSKTRGGLSSVKLTIALLDAMWWRKGSVSLMPGSGSSDASGLGYEHGYEHDYSKPRSGGLIDTGCLIPCKPFIVMYGPVQDPYIIISGNKYQVTGTIASGARVEIDGREKTVKMIAQDGTVTDKFSDALRGSGEGGGEYCFQPIPPGSLGVTWDDSFGVDVGWYEERSEVPWASI